MLRALNLQDHPRLYSAALHRVQPAAEGQEAPEVPALQPSLEALLRDLRPACVLVLGLATARAVLQRQEALGRLRAEPHRSEEHTSELQSPCNLVCRLLLEKNK